MNQCIPPVSIDSATERRRVTVPLNVGGELERPPRPCSMNQGHSAANLTGRWKMVVGRPVSPSSAQEHKGKDRERRGKSDSRREHVSPPCDVSRTLGMVAPSLRSMILWSLRTRLMSVYNAAGAVRPLGPAAVSLPT